MKQNADNGEQLVITTRRFFHGHPRARHRLEYHIVPPAKMGAAADRGWVERSETHRCTHDVAMGFASLYPSCEFSDVTCLLR